MSITAKELVNGWTHPNGDLTAGDKDAEAEVIYNAGSDTIFLGGFFDADTLIELAMHMRSTQK